MEERPIPWNTVLDDYERRIKVLEESVCCCSLERRRSGTRLDLLEVVRTTSAEGSSGEGLRQDAQNTSQATTRE